MTKHGRRQITAWPLSKDEIDTYTTGGCFLLAWALNQVALHIGLSSGKIILSWIRSFDERHALHAAYLTIGNSAIDATGVKPLDEYFSNYSTDGWTSAVSSASVLERDGYVFPEDQEPHEKAIEIAERLRAYL